MIENDCNIMNNMSKSDFRDCRSLVIEMVLHTGQCTKQANRTLRSREAKCLEHVCFMTIENLVL